MLQSVRTRKGRGWEPAFRTPSQEQGWLSGEKDEPGNSILTSITNLLSSRRQGTVSQPELAFRNEEVIILIYLRELHSLNFPKLWYHNLQLQNSSLQGPFRESIIKWTQMPWGEGEVEPNLSWAQFGNRPARCETFPKIKALGPQSCLGQPSHGLNLKN